MNATKQKQQSVTIPQYQGGGGITITPPDRSDGGPTQIERRARFAKGLPLQIGIARAHGRKTADAERQLPIIQNLCVELEQMERELAKPQPDFLKELRAKAAKELRDKLPACFPSLRDAVTFTAGLPFVDANNERAQWLAARDRLGRHYNIEQKRFWNLADEIARTLDTGNRPDRAADNIVMMGACQ